MQSGGINEKYELPYDLIISGQGDVKVNSKPVNLMVLSKNKIPNLKHQITNKSQISIFNDQNYHDMGMASAFIP